MGNKHDSDQKLLEQIIVGIFSQAGCSTMSSPQSGDISGYHLSGEWATLIRPSQHFLSAWLSFNPLPLLKCVRMCTKLRGCLGIVIQGVWMCLLSGRFDSC